MNLRRLAGLAVGLALPLTLVASASADYSDAQYALLETVTVPSSADVYGVEGEEGGAAIVIPVAGGVTVAAEGARVPVADVYWTIYNDLVYGPEE